jgi:hypothetical protein
MTTLLLEVIRRKKNRCHSPPKTSVGGCSPSKVPKVGPVRLDRADSQEPPAETHHCLGEKRLGAWPSPRLVLVSARRLQLMDTSVLSLRSDALDDKCSGIRRAMPDRLDRVIGRRIIPGACFLHAIKSNYHNALRRFTFKNRCFALVN